MSTQQTKLTQADLRAIEAEVKMRAGQPPTVEALRQEGHQENRQLIAILDFIQGAGRIMTLIIAEAIQSVAALAIGVVFAVLEYWRVLHGAEALGQPAEQAALIAAAVVTANVIHPIYDLRQLKGKSTHTITRMTGRGYTQIFIKRLFGQPQTESVDWSYNPVLAGAGVIITWTTILLAVYDLIAPLLTAIITGQATKPGLILVIELAMGFGLSLAGVLFLQAAAHEIGVRTLTDQPQRLTELLGQRQTAHYEHVEAIRREVTEAHQQRKLADVERKNGPFGNTPPGAGGHANMVQTHHANGHTADVKNT